MVKQTADQGVKIRRATPTAPTSDPQPARNGISTSPSSLPTIGHAEIFTATSIAFDDCHDGIAKIIEFTDDLVESKPSGKIASVVAGATQERCRAIDKYGDCPRKKACIYSHIPSNPPKMPNPDKFNNKKDNKGKTPATTAPTRPAYTVVSKKHRAAVGPGRE